jgi:hypothetical protein
VDYPIGAVLERLGQRPPRTWLQDPFAILRQVRMGQQLMPRLPKLAPLIMRATRKRASKVEPPATAPRQKKPTGSAEGSIHA